ncbi:MAG: hypothetical protein P4M10_00415 [Verrucomicrobiae bacterium]|nr:hypothetical protein [Verrucomicrobiae bacterium]
MKTIKFSILLAVLLLAWSSPTPAEPASRATNGIAGAPITANPALSTCACTNPVFVTSDTNGGWSNGGYYVHNNMWNASSGETLFARAYNNWYVTANYPDTTDVKTYPNVHEDINDPKGAPLDNYHTIDSTFAARAPHVGIYDVAYDIWLNGVGGGRGTTEFMIWTENYKQVPLGSVQAHPAFEGMSYQAYHYTGGGANVITLVPVNVMTSGNLNLKAMLDWAINQGWMPSNPAINQICYGVEICSTGNQAATFCFTDFSVSMK